MHKKQMPPSGDKHDYMSQAPYWWPDPSKPDGLPYIRRDGERNPELKKISDSDEMDALIADVELLGLAYYYTRQERYAAFAAKLIKTWFLKAKTRQNPNLNFSQGIPGINKGRGIGIIESRYLYKVIDAAILLRGSKKWSQKDHQALQSWFANYLNWLRESPLGQDEADEHNNHGTFYDVQVVSFALFTGQTQIAERQLNVSKQRLATQLATDGSQPHELARTASWGYANMNLSGFMLLARLAENLQLDLWHYETTDGKGIYKALDWLLPYVETDKDWPYKQIKPKDYDHTVEILRWAHQAYGGSAYLRLANRWVASKDDLYPLLFVP